MERIDDVPYVSNGHVRQKLDLYLPVSETRRPLVVYIHGGAFMYGSKKSPLIPLRLLDRGFAIASLDYRLSGDAIFPAAVEDCKAAIRWLRTHAAEYKLDSDRFLAWGESAGAYMAIMIGTTTGMEGYEVGENLEVSSAVQGVVDYYGPTDFLQMDAHAPAGSQMNHDGPDSPESRFLGGTITEFPDLVHKANPITYITQKTCPFFVAHGTEDQIVACHQSELLVRALDKAGVSTIFHPVPGADHVFKGITEERATALDQATNRFVDTVFRL